uniref:Retrotransposon gag domain-containing protein n=1 Tax=Amphimedon queenslandica TaxID=400682 RepID=A0A1X7U9J4_AMPQE
MIHINCAPIQRCWTSYQVTAPQPFNFATPRKWEKWFRRFERFRGASGLFEKEEEVQVNTLIYMMGAEADKIFRFFKLTTAQAKKYDTVIEKFTSHFIKKRNVIYERARFNMRCQEEGESVDAFVTNFYSLAEHCGFKNIHDQLIRDRIVVGIRDAKLSSH